ncbi:MAG: carbohydrate ABC transporter permease [Cetobacterium sp.]|uniref:carbohydrate ABC transporter permease n=1 Tax=Cetobacterium sp. TaxID=2071632 RepID=UPI003EE6C38D
MAESLVLEREKNIEKKTLKQFLRNKEVQKKLLLITFLFIPTVMLLSFIIYPALKLVYISLTDWNGISESYNFIGFENFKTLFTSKSLWTTLKANSIYFTLHFLLIPVELYIAFLLDRFIKGSEFFKSIFFMPYIINGVAVAYMFSFLYSSEDGVLNAALELMKMSKIGWLSDPKIVNYSLAGVSLWRFTGMPIILFLAGLQSIPKDMLEAAVIDGASVFQQFSKIIMPNMKTVTSIVLFLNARGALMVFDIPFVMTSGGPKESSATFALNLVKIAFEFENFGLAASMAIVLIVMILLLSKLQDRLLNMKG